MSLRDPEECICSVVNGGMPCTSSRCIRLPSWEKNMRDLGDRIRVATGVPPADIGPIDIPPRPPEERAGIFDLAAAQPARTDPIAAVRATEVAALRNQAEQAGIAAADALAAAVPIQKSIEDLRQAQRWQEHRKTWLETGDMSALTAMDQYDPARMSGDDWLDCDEYDARHAPRPGAACRVAARGQAKEPGRSDPAGGVPADLYPGHPVRPDRARGDLAWPVSLKDGRMPCRCRT